MSGLSPYTVAQPCCGGLAGYVALEQSGINFSSRYVWDIDQRLHGFFLEGYLLENLISLIKSRFTEVPKVSRGRARAGLINGLKPAVWGWCSNILQERGKPRH